MQIYLIAVGRIKETYLQEGIAEYIKRLRPYVKLNIIEITEEKRTGHLSPADQKRVLDEEGTRILDSIPPDSITIALDSKGVTWSSETLADNLHRYEIAGRTSLSIIIGGDIGLSDTVTTRCHVRLSLSRMTFTHQMVRQILLEQIYRAYKINHHEPYHK
jgi:23S rRNA (pseudouridine1915-N3)-methyltransferase